MLTAEAAQLTAEAAQLTVETAHAHCGGHACSAAEIVQLTAEATQLTAEAARAYCRDDQVRTSPSCSGDLKCPSRTSASRRTSSSW